jgi:hypothetical protein
MSPKPQVPPDPTASEAPIADQSDTDSPPPVLTVFTLKDQLPRGSRAARRPLTVAQFNLGDVHGQ